MGRKVNPIGYRLAFNHSWDSRWFAKGRDFADMVTKDAQARAYVRKQFSQASISRIEIERRSKTEAKIIIHTARPGMVIGKKGEDIERLRQDLRKLLGVYDVSVDIKEIRQPETDARLIAQSIATQLEKRVMFRRAMKRALGNAVRLEVKGIKIMSSGRLNGMEIARTEWYREGRVPLHTLRAEVDYGLAEAKTSMGVIGIKVWVYKGDRFAPDKDVKFSPVEDEDRVAVQETDNTEPSRKTVTKEAVSDSTDAEEKGS